MKIVAPIISILLFVFVNLLTPKFNTNFINVGGLKLLASESISLDKRYDNVFVNGVFKDNILLTIEYLSGKVKKKQDIDWKNIDKPLNYTFRLRPNETFAFHKDVLPEYENTVVKTTNARFNFEDGFKSDGYLTGDGVCHLASLMYWVAKEAGLDTYAPTNHDFRAIPEIEKKYGVAIYQSPDQKSSSALQNLYIKNNKNEVVNIELKYQNNKLKISAYQINRKKA